MRTAILSFLLSQLIGISSAYATEKEDENPYIKCVRQNDQDVCLEALGRDKWMPFKSPEDCIIVKQILETAKKMNWKYSYKILYFNERCHRLDQPHF